MENEKLHKNFNNEDRPHVLMITNHGCHTPRITVTIDTAGQNFYVNDYSKALVLHGYKVTILNRGGYNHPVTNEPLEGVVYFEEEWGEELGGFCRVVYLEDDEKKFIPKEDLNETNLEKEKDFLFQIAKELEMDFEKIYFMNSHYWDAGILGIMINDELINKDKSKIPHVWTAHSLGKIKQENYKNESPEVIELLKFPKRIAFENKIFKKVDAVVPNAELIREYIAKYEETPKNDLWFPPGVDTTLYYPREKEQCKAAIKVLFEETQKKEEEIKRMIQEKAVVFEISRTQESKRKDTILEAFAKIENHDEAMLIMAVNQGNETYDQLMKIYEENRDKNIVLLDRFITRQEGAELYALSDIFATASQVESWGMTSHEAAASKCAVIASKYVPSVTEVLKESAFIIEDQEPEKYAEKMDLLIKNRELREKMGNEAKELVFENYSWKALTANFLEEMKQKNIVK